jgi:hypothetical protein
MIHKLTAGIFWMQKHKLALLIHHKAQLHKLTLFKSLMDLVVGAGVASALAAYTTNRMNGLEIFMLT